MHTMIAWLPRTRKLSKFIEVSSQQSLSRPPEDIKKPPMFPGVLKGNIGQKPFNATVFSTTVGPISFRVTQTVRKNWTQFFFRQKHFTRTGDESFTDFWWALQNIRWNLKIINQMALFSLHINRFYVICLFPYTMKTFKNRRLY